MSYADGTLILSGVTKSTNNIATSGSFQSTLGGLYDIYIAKMTPGGQRLWGTYWGGVGDELAYAYKTDNFGHLYVSGNTDSSTNLATPGVFKMYPTGQTDCFLGKFDASGFRIWSTYYGGSELEEIGVCSVDNDGNVYLCGETNSTDGIATTGSYQASFAGGQSDAFLVKFDSTGHRLWGTYYGGTKADEATYCDADGNNNVILAGETNSPSNISTPSAFQPTFGNPPALGESDGFLVLFNGLGQRQWETYYGGTEWDDVSMCEIGNDHYLYIGGQTTSPNAIASPNGFQTTYGGAQDDFLAKFNISGARIWGTYYGGTGNEEWGLLAVDDSSNVFLSGRYLFYHKHIYTKCISTRSNREFWHIPCKI
jgi:hypothetical protein